MAEVQVSSIVEIEIKNKTVIQVAAEVAQALVDNGSAENMKLDTTEWRTFITAQPRCSVAVQLGTIKFVFAGADEKWFDSFKSIFDDGPTKGTPVAALDEEEGQANIDYYLNWIDQVGATYGPTFVLEFAFVIETLKKMHEMKSWELTKYSLPGQNDFTVLQDKLEKLMAQADKKYFPLSYAIGDFYWLKAKTLEAQLHLIPMFSGQEKLWDKIIETYLFSTKIFLIGALDCLQFSTEKADSSLIFLSTAFPQAVTKFLFVARQMALAQVARKLIGLEEPIEDWSDKGPLIKALLTRPEISEDEDTFAFLKEGVKVAKIVLGYPFADKGLIAPFMQEYGMVLMLSREFRTAQKAFHFVLSLDPDWQDPKDGLEIVEKYLTN